MENVNYNKTVLKDILVDYLIEYLLEKKEGGFSFIEENRANKIADSIIIDYEFNLPIDK